MNVVVFPEADCPECIGMRTENGVVVFAPSIPDLKPEEWMVLVSERLCSLLEEDREWGGERREKE